MQAFECRGLWTLPDLGTPGVPGMLHVSDDGEMRLALMGSLGPLKGLHEPKNHAIIIGSVDGPFGNDVTLTDCYNTSSQFGSFAGVREEYRARRGFFGAPERAIRPYVSASASASWWAWSLGTFVIRFPPE